jgi:hypothetical protein
VWSLLVAASTAITQDEVFATQSIGTQACAWGTGSALLGESVHKAFLRDTLQVPQSTTCTVVLMMSEVGARPLAQAWANQLIGWWNRIVSRKDGDMVKEALRESVRRAVGGRLARPQNCWANVCATGTLDQAQQRRTTRA